MSHYDRSIATNEVKLVEALWRGALTLACHPWLAVLLYALQLAYALLAGRVLSDWLGPHVGENRPLNLMALATVYRQQSTLVQEGLWRLIPAMALQSLLFQTLTVWIALRSLTSASARRPLRLGRRLFLLRLTAVTAQLITAFSWYLLAQRAYRWTLPLVDERTAVAVQVLLFLLFGVIAGAIAIQERLAQTAVACQATSATAALATSVELVQHRAGTTLALTLLTLAIPTACAAAGAATLIAFGSDSFAGMACAQSFALAYAAGRVWGYGALIAFFGPTTTEGVP